MMKRGGEGKNSIKMQKSYVLARLMISCMMGVLLAGAISGQAFAVDAGTYLVTMKPSYTDPESGKVEDPGNNEAIGQGMAEKLCGPTGLLEVDASGEMYLTVRYYLSQFVKDVTFEERSGGSYTSLIFQKTQTKAPVEGADNLDDKYGYADYRMRIGSMDSVFRGKAYIDAMGRNVVYFFTVSNPARGSGDFIVSLQTQPAETEALASQAAVMENAGEGAENQQEEMEAGSEASRTGTERTQTAAAGVAEGGGSNGRGEANAQVTGIPPRPSRNGSSHVSEAQMSFAESVSSAASFPKETYALVTKYDLSSVPADEARKLTKPILEAATGITGMTGSASKEVSVASMGISGRSNGNKTVMMVLLGISAVLMARFGLAAIQQERNRRMALQSAGQEPEYQQEAAAMQNDSIESFRKNMERREKELSQREESLKEKEQELRKMEKLLLERRETDK
ncbi:MAG: hypothetical protein LUH21_16220 [Clostridiales bacterium]|nr:hypothetical protein [Clostridiales bacterium]